MKSFAAVVALLILAGCATSTTSPSLKNAPEYILLSAPGQVQTYDLSAVTPSGLYVRGMLTDTGFRPVGDIQGKGKFCADGKDWLSLSELKVYTASDGKTPVAPYILGCSNGRGFEPASRAIVAQ